MLIILDFGMGNLMSIKKAVEYLGYKVKIAKSPSQLRKATKIIFPGVGAFGDAMRELKKRNLIEEILSFALRKKGLFLGICLGMQVLFDSSQEAPGIKGLGLFKGEVKRFSPPLKIPHMGWNQLTFKNKHPLFKGIKINSFVYFCHSYYVKPLNEEYILAKTFYGVEFASVVQKGNIFGVQFHPEKSQSIGLSILKNFMEL